MSEKCEICGRTQEQIETELEGDFDITKKEGESVWRCGKCRQEYNRESGNLQQDGSQSGFDPKEKSSGKDWKEEILA